MEGFKIMLYYRAAQPLSRLAATASRLPTRSALNDCHRQSAPYPTGEPKNVDIPYGIRCRGYDLHVVPFQKANLLFENGV